MSQRRPLKRKAFEDVESVRSHAQGSSHGKPHIARSFAAIVTGWEMSEGNALDLGSGTGILALELGKGLPELEFVGLASAARGRQSYHDQGEHEVSQQQPPRLRGLLSPH